MRSATSHVVHFRLALALAGVLGVGTSGCLIIPTPEFNTGNARANINKKTPNQFESGKTTRAEVMMALGEPDAVSPEESKLAYRSEKVCGLWFVGGYGSAAGGTITKDRCLIAEFDPQSVLVKVERSATLVGPSPVARALSRTAPTDSAAKADASLQTTVRLQKPARWLAGVDGYKPRGAASMLGEAGQLLLTDAELQFISNGQFANAPPALTLAYATMVEVHVDKYVFGRRLVVRCHGDEVHSFDVLGPRSMATDKQALLAVVEFLQDRIKH